MTSHRGVNWNSHAHHCGALQVSRLPPSSLPRSEPAISNRSSFAIAESGILSGMPVPSVNRSMPTVVRSSAR